MGPLVTILEAAFGVAVISWILWDVYQSVVVPRSTPTHMRLARFLVIRSWPIWRWRARHAHTAEGRERLLGSYAPALVVGLLVCWIAGLILGFGLVFHALAPEIRPHSLDFGTALYFAGVTLLTIGFGDVVTEGSLARAIAVLAAGTGLGVIALGITYLFSLYSSFQRREVLVTMLDARAGAPPSGLALLETYRSLDMLDELPGMFAEWERWCAEVLDSHLAYPILAYFRSSHDNESWVSALGAVLDASVLVVTTLEGIPAGQAELMRRGGSHLVEDLSAFFGFRASADAGVERFEWEQARQQLAASGIAVRGDVDASWGDFVALRTTYAGRLNAMAAFWITPSARWIGDRATLHPSTIAGSVAPVTEEPAG